MTSDTVALIPLRGGSQGIPGKNIKSIAGKPLCRWTIEAACRSNSIGKVYVSTDSDQIKSTVLSFGLPVEVIDRPPQFATNAASTESVMLHFAEQVDFKALVTIQATSPLTTASDLDRAIEMMHESRYDSIVTGVVQKRFVWSLDGRPLNYNPITRPLRQEWKGSLIENGAFYITKREILIELKCRLGNNVGVYEMDPTTTVEIDEPEDWTICESILRQRAFQGDYVDVLKGIRLVISDVDGTLTDGGMYYDARGEAIKKFHTRDAHGLAMLRELGVDVVIVTREDSRVTAARAQKIGVPVHLGVKDKGRFLSTLCQQYQITPAEVCMIGDDLNDLEIMQQSAFSACPSDAVAEVRQIASYVAKVAGGCGAVREICEILIRNR